jgi:hypothetical protein
VTLEEVIDLLTLAAAFDRRHIGEADSIAWHAALGDLAFTDAQAALIGHYQDSREFVMPADVRTRVKAARRDRLAREVVPAPDIDPDLPGRYRSALAAAVRRIGDGFASRVAIGSVVREGPPPEAFTAAKAALAPPLTKQERAALQAAQSRAEREALAGKEPGEAGTE